MLFNVLTQIFSPLSNHQRQNLTPEKNLPQEYLDYARTSYPSNHTYKIRNRELNPLRQLAKRQKAIKKLLPHPLNSLLDIGSSKGFFVFDAVLNPDCERALGIDVNPYDIDFTNIIREHIRAMQAQFKLMRLHELADQIDQFGGPFQTVLINNQYQYLYFGSDTFPASYLDHDFIFQNLRRVCSQRVIFNNRLSLHDIQNDQQVEKSGNKKLAYSEQSIYTAASKYFDVTKHGSLGGYPLWTLDVKR